MNIHEYSWAVTVSASLLTWGADWLIVKLKVKVQTMHLKRKMVR